MLKIDEKHPKFRGIGAGYTKREDAKNHKYTKGKNNRNLQTTQRSKNKSTHLLQKPTIQRRRKRNVISRQNRKRNYLRYGSKSTPKQ